MICWSRWKLIYYSCRKPLPPVPEFCFSNKNCWNKSPYIFPCAWMFSCDGFSNTFRTDSSSDVSPSFEAFKCSNKNCLLDFLRCTKSNAASSAPSWICYCWVVSCSETWLSDWLSSTCGSFTIKPAFNATAFSGIVPICLRCLYAGCVRAFARIYKCGYSSRIISPFVFWRLRPRASAISGKILFYSHTFSYFFR